MFMVPKFDAKIETQRLNDKNIIFFCHHSHTPESTHLS